MNAPTTAREIAAAAPVAAPQETISQTLAGFAANLRFEDIPAKVVDLAMDNNWSAMRAWREHLDCTQAVVAKRMGITQGAYAQLEAKKTIRKASREKVAKALGIDQTQLDF